MGGPLSVTFANIFLTKLEKDEVKPMNPKFYKRFVDDVINRRYVDQKDELFTRLNSYHQNIKFTIEENPSKYLDTEITKENNSIKTSVYRKPNKYTAHWKSKVPKRYKRNAINGDLYRSHRISTNFNDEKSKFEKNTLSRAIQRDSEKL